MQTIADPTLTVHTVAGHPGQRRVRVDYDVVLDPTDPIIGTTIVERIVVRAVDEHDAATQPPTTPIVDAERTFVAASGIQHRTFEQILHRVDLDVVQDWWSADQGGEPKPIAEWLDHLAAEIGLHLADKLTSRATTPVVTGSWGALGHD
jgi:hypothetical protein